MNTRSDYKSISNKNLVKAVLRLRKEDYIRIKRITKNLVPMAVFIRAILIAELNKRDEIDEVKKCH